MTFNGVSPSRSLDDLISDLEHYRDRTTPASSLHFLEMPSFDGRRCSLGGVPIFWTERQIALMHYENSVGIRSTAATVVSAWLSVRYQEPRGTRWSDYPILPEPVVGFLDEGSAFTVRRSNLPDMTYSGSHVLQAMKSADAVFIHRSDLPVDMEARRMLDISQYLALRPGVPVFLVAGMQVTPYSLHDLLEEFAWYWQVLRFEHIYSVNFNAIAGKALRHLMPPAKAHEPQAPRTAPTVVNSTAEFMAVVEATERELADVDRADNAVNQVKSGYLGKLGKPMALQVLYRLRRQGPMPMISTEDGQGLFHKHYRGFTDNDPLILWRGSAGCTPVSIGLQGLYPLRKDDVFGLLIERGKDSWALTDLGHSFLDLLHPDNEDADVLGRWRESADQGYAQASMDAWLLRHFRKMKTRVNLVPAW